MSEKHYVGDGVYLEYTQYGDVVLTTENGYRSTNRIVLEPEVWRALLRALEREQLGRLKESGQ